MLFRNKTRYVVHTMGDPVLRTPAQPVVEVTPEIREFAEMMTGAMRAFDGIGLAAPQAGRSLRLVVLDVPADSMGEVPTQGELALLPQMPLVLVNPEILSASETCSVRDEGCLSLPDVYAPVVRPSSVVLRAGTLDGGVIECECGGLLGRCIQHELDHLDGHLFIDRVSEAAMRGISRDLKKLERFGEKHHYHRVAVK